MTGFQIGLSLLVAVAVIYLWIDMRQQKRRDEEDE